ncbi:MAG: hypothetical protein PHE89_05050 [Alphaproteobacteria bacterium]|nr:hypothetical protein [Alphaproteobacteria bacterium]
MSETIKSSYLESQNLEGDIKNTANALFGNFSREETFMAQTEIDKHNLEFIAQAHQSNEIDKDSKEFLENLYADTMFKYGQVYKALRKCLGNPEAIRFKNLKTGEVFEDLKSSHHKNYDNRRLVTPSTSVQIVFKDKYGNDLYLDLPGIKDIKRAVEKVKIGGKYHTAYELDKRQTRIKHIPHQSEFVEEINQFIHELSKDKKYQKGLIALQSRYLKAFNYYVKELKNYKLTDKAKSLLLKKQLYKAEEKFRDHNLLGALGDIHAVAMQIRKKDAKMTGFFNEKTLFSRYLLELENVVAGDSVRDFKKNKDYQSFLNIYHKALGDDKDYIDDMAKISKPYQRLNDIYRCSITTKYYDNIANLKTVLTKEMSVVSEDDKFYGNNNPKHEKFKNSKGYRDDKLVFDMQGFPLEVQLKIGILSSVDYETHRIYEEKRALEEELRDCYDHEEVAKLNMEIQKKDMEVRSTYVKIAEKYNRKVMETAAEMELDLFKAEWEKRDDETPKLNIEALRGFLKARDDDYSNLLKGKKKYAQVAEFLEDNLLVSPFKTLVLEDEIVNIAEMKYGDLDECEHEKINANSDYPVIPNMKSFAERYLSNIERAYIGTIDGKVKESIFEDYKKAEAERIKSQNNVKKHGSFLYSRRLSQNDIADINRREREYLKETGKKDVENNVEGVKINPKVVPLKTKDR